MTTLPHENLDLIKKVRGDSYLTIGVKDIVVTDSLETEICNIRLCLHNGVVIDASGVGMVDAIFSGLKAHYHDQFESLKDLELTKFFVKAKSRGTTAEVEVTLEVRNSYGRYFTFTDNSRSLTASAARVSAAVIEYFCNSEVAFFQVLNALKDAKARGRDDLVTRFTHELSMLVKNTCYTTLLDKAKHEFIDEVSRSKK